MPLIYVDDDITSGEYEMIAHQCNCVTSAGAGLYSVIAEKYPQAHIYPTRSVASKPGTIVVTEPVIGMMAQYYPGKPNKTNDTPEARLIYFEKCLEKIAALELKSIAFPHGIGCGLARGNWDDYHELIEDFAEENPDTIVYIVKKQ